jgi:predicted acylesterase/phospholipase RssA
MPNAQRMVNYLRAFLGVRYYWPRWDQPGDNAENKPMVGNDDPVIGFDCSGFAQAFHAFLGVHIRRDADQVFRRAARAREIRLELRDRAPRRDLVFRRKQDDRSFLARGALGFRPGEGVVLPLGLVQGQKITQVLRTATLRVGDVTDFDELPTPFRALATDLETGEPVVLASGDLATVLRASMSAPGVLAPVEIDGRLLVDGGLVDNLPVSLAREMGVDVLIAVDVSFPLADRAGLGSALDVTNQMIGIMVRRGTRESRAALAPNDVLIEPDLGRMTAVEFGPRRAELPPRTASNDRGDIARSTLQLLQGV